MMKHEIYRFLLTIVEDVTRFHTDLQVIFGMLKCRQGAEKLSGLKNMRGLLRKEWNAEGGMTDA